MQASQNPAFYRHGICSVHTNIPLSVKNTHIKYIKMRSSSKMAKKTLANRQGMMYASCGILKGLGKSHYTRRAQRNEPNCILHKMARPGFPSSPSLVKGIG